MVHVLFVELIRKLLSMWFVRIALVLTRAILDLRRKGSKYVKCYYINSTGNYNVVDYTHVA